MVMEKCNRVLRFAMWEVLCLVILSVGCSAIEDITLVSNVGLNEIPGASEARHSDGSFSSHFRQFLTTHQLRIRLDELMPKEEDVQHGLRNALDYLNGLDADDEDESGRKGGGGGGFGGGKKGGGGAILMMATMMGGTMAALGFGAVGMLAMKALTVSAMAFMLSAVLGLKKLLSKGDDEGGHSVSYIPVHHSGHRRRRDASHLAYFLHSTKPRHL